MGVKIGRGTLSDSFVEPAGPSGRLQVFEPKDFPYLNTGKSLVFVIARNGMVWGKYLDRQSSKGDIELEVFWPSEDGCLVRQWGLMREWGGEGYGSKLGPTGQYTLLTARKTLNASVEQDRKIENILSQKDIIQYELGTLMVRPYVTASWNHLPQYQRMTNLSKLNFWLGDPCKIMVVDCSYDRNKRPDTVAFTWKFFYDDLAADFKFLSNNIYDKTQRLFIGSTENPIGHSDIVNYESNFDNGTITEVRRCFAAKLFNKQFDMSGVKLRGNTKVNPCLRIMYGEYDFFEYFKVDDAVLILEEETISANSPKLFWTLGIAQNKLVREMARLASNNPDLFAPLIPKQHREDRDGGKKI